MRRIKRLKERLGANGPGLTVAVIAMVVALTGGAFAAGGGLTGKQKKEVKNIAKSFQGTGPTGAQGAVGPQGAAGAKGDKGDTGLEGKSGKSLTVTPIATGNALECEERGGALIKQEGAPTGTEVCNGEPGPEGSPWTAGGTLPAGATETGAFSVQGTEEDTNGLFTTISFSLPLEEALDAAHVLVGSTFPKPTACPGSFIAPAAAPGFLCVYVGGEVAGTAIERIEDLESPLIETLAGAGKAGARLRFESPSEEFAFANGTFAVTAPLAPTP